LLLLLLLLLLFFALQSPIYFCMHMLSLLAIKKSRSRVFSDVSCTCYVRASGHLGFQINIKHNCVKYHRGNCQIVRRNKSCGKIDKIMTKEKTNEISL
jgi:hypothetical protein